jgi:hypothetical protein
MLPFSWKGEIMTAVEEAARVSKARKAKPFMPFANCAAA